MEKMLNDAPTPRRASDGPGAVGQGTRVGGREDPGPQPRSTLTSRLMWSEVLTLAYCGEGRHVSPKGLPHPRACLDSPLRHHVGRREGILCPLWSSQGPLDHPELKAVHRAVPHAVPSVRPESVVRDYFLFVNFIIIKTVDVYRALDAASPCSKAQRGFSHPHAHFTEEETGSESGRHLSNIAQRTSGRSGTWAWSLSAFCAPTSRLVCEHRVGKVRDRVILCGVPDTLPREETALWLQMWGTESGLDSSPARELTAV